MDINYRDLIGHIIDGLYLVDKKRKIIYWNKSAERITGYSKDDVIGHACHENILVHVDTQGRGLCRSVCPLAATIKDGNPRDAEVYLHHKQGHRVPVWVRTTQLKDSTGQVVGGAELFSDLSANNAIASKIEELERLSLIDALTQLANRRFVEMELVGRLSEMQRYQLSFGLLMLDIDFFKKVNDRYGHDVGDRVLQTVSKTMVQSARPHDLFGRWGGEEFIGIIRNVDQEGLRAVCERLRTLIANSFVKQNGGYINVTASIGATVAARDDNPESIVKRTDQLLYSSKREGRDRCTLG
jgi:diguanylate cyclase (GGDEF)-like protein/PAS domain S-box-containing protein